MRNGQGPMRKFCSSVIVPMLLLAPGAEAADLPPELLRTTDIGPSTRLEPDRGR